MYRKKIRLKGSSIFDRRKPLNRSRKVKRSSVNWSFIKKKPINKITKTKQVVRKETKRPYSNYSKTPSNNRYLPDIIEKRYVFMMVIIVLFFMVIINIILYAVYTFSKDNECFGYFCLSATLLQLKYPPNVWCTAARGVRGWCGRLVRPVKRA